MQPYCFSDEGDTSISSVDFPIHKKENTDWIEDKCNIQNSSMTRSPSSALPKKEYCERKV